MQDRRFKELAPIGPYWPDAALRRGLGGRASIDCRVDPKGRLDPCNIVAERTTHPTNNLARGPYLQLATTNSIYVVWRTEGKATPVVRYGASPGQIDQMVPASNIITRIGTTNKPTEQKKFLKLHSAPSGTLQFEAKITRLQPDTLYYYAVFNEDTLLAGPDDGCHFRTHPRSRG